MLSLKGSALTIGEDGNPTLVDKRLTDIIFTVTTRLNFDPENENEEAGMVLLNNDTHFDILVYSKNGKRYTSVKLQFGQTLNRSQEIALKKGAVDVEIKGNGPEFVFSYA